MESFEGVCQKSRLYPSLRIATLYHVVVMLKPQKLLRRFFSVAFIGPLFLRTLTHLWTHAIDVKELATSVGDTKFHWTPFWKMRYLMFRAYTLLDRSPPLILLTWFNYDCIYVCLYMFLRIIKLNFNFVKLFITYKYINMGFIIKYL